MLRVKLKFYEKNYHREKIKNYNLIDSTYTSIPQDFVDEIKENIFSIIIENTDGEIVGCFRLDRTKNVREYNYEPKNTILLRSYSIDENFRKKGYALESLKNLKEFIHENISREIEEVILAVNINNFVAKRLYIKSGFIDSKKRKMGEKGMLEIYSMKIKEEG